MKWGRSNQGANKPFYFFSNSSCPIIPREHHFSANLYAPHNGQLYSVCDWMPLSHQSDDACRLGINHYVPGRAFVAFDYACRGGVTHTL